MGRKARRSAVICRAWWLGPPADALRVAGVRPVRADRAGEGAGDRCVQAREFLLDRRAVLGMDLVTQFLEHGDRPVGGG